jgi:hypothetical protein
MKVQKDGMNKNSASLTRNETRGSWLLQTTSFWGNARNLITFVWFTCHTSPHYYLERNCVEKNDADFSEKDYKEKKPNVFCIHFFLMRSKMSLKVFRLLSSLDLERSLITSFYFDIEDILFKLLSKSY